MGDVMKRTVKERLQSQLLIEIGIFFIFVILNMISLFDFSQLIYNIMDLFNYKYSTMITKILQNLPFLNCLFVTYIISININFNNVNFLTKRYVDDYISTTTLVNLVIYIFIAFYSTFSNYQEQNIVIIFNIIFIIINFLLKILYTKIYFKRKSKKFITEEKYYQEQKVLIPKKQINEVTEEKLNKNFKKLKILTCIFFVLCIINYCLLFIIPSCGFFSSCHPDGLRIVIINFMVLIPTFIISVFIILVESITISHQNK